MPDAKQRMSYIRESLAKHQYEIAEFYLKRRLRCGGESNSR